MPHRMVTKDKRGVKKAETEPPAYCDIIKVLAHCFRTMSIESGISAALYNHK